MIQLRVGGLFRMRYFVYLNGRLIGKIKHMSDLPGFMKSRGL